MKETRFIIGLITFSIIASIIFFQIFKLYNSSYIEINKDESFRTTVNKNHTMSGSIYINGKYSLPLVYNNNNCLCDELKEGDLLYKFENEELFFKVRNQDTLVYR